MLPAPQPASRPRYTPTLETMLEMRTRVGMPAVPTTVHTSKTTLPYQGNRTGGLPVLIADANLQVPTADITWAGFINLVRCRSIKRLTIGHGAANRFVFRRSSHLVPRLGMSYDQKNGGATDGSSIDAAESEFYSDIDGLWPSDGIAMGYGGRPSVLDRCVIRGNYILSFSGFPVAAGNADGTVKGLAGTTGEPVALPQMSTAVPAALSTYYAQGQLIYDAQTLWQVTTAGTTSSVTPVIGSDNVSHTWTTVWPGGVADGVIEPRFMDLAAGATSQPFANGPNTLRLVYIGDIAHGDGLQLPRAGITQVVGCKIGGFQNSECFVQASAKSYDGVSLDPTGPFIILDSDVQAYSNQWIYFTCNASDAVYGSGVFPGRFKRDKVTGVWTANTLSYLGRPEFCAVIGCRFLNRTVDGAVASFKTTGAYPIERTPTSAVGNSTATNGSGATGTGDYPMYLPSEARRRELIANQTNTDGTPNFATYEARFKHGFFPGACDARAAIVWAGNTRQDGTMVHPLSRQGRSGADAFGYYIGV